MPFQSEKQRRFLHANHPEIAKRWESEYATGGISNHFRRRVGLKKGSGGPGPGGQGARGQATQNPGSSGGPPGGGGGGQGGSMYYKAPTPTYQNVHQTGAISQTPGQTITTTGDGKTGDHHPPIIPKKTYGPHTPKNMYLPHYPALSKWQKEKVRDITTRAKKGTHGGYGPYSDTWTKIQHQPSLSKWQKEEVDDIITRAKKGTYGGYGPYTPPVDLGLVEELSTKDYKPSGPSMDEMGQWYDADGKPIDNPNINPELAGMIKPIGGLQISDYEKALRTKTDQELKDWIKDSNGDAAAEAILEERNSEKVEKKKTTTEIADEIGGSYTNIIGKPTDQGVKLVEELQEFKYGNKEMFQDAISKEEAIKKMEKRYEGEGMDDVFESFYDIGSKKEIREKVEEGWDLAQLQGQTSFTAAEGGVARKNYFHGGILDINASEEIISDDGNDIELTDYNAAFDDPKDLSTGVKSLFQAKDGGTPRRSYFTGAYGVGGTENEGSQNTGNQGHGGGADVMPVGGSGANYGGPPGGGDKGMTYTQSGSPHLNEEEETRKFAIQEDIRRREEEKYDTKEQREAEVYGLRKWQENEKRVTKVTVDFIKKNLKRLNATKYYSEKYGDDIIGMLQKGWDVYKSIPAATLLGIAKELMAEYKLTKEGNAILEQWSDLIGGPPGTNPQAYDDLYYALEKRKAKYRYDDDTGDDGPIYAPLTGAVSEEYAQGYYNDGMSDLDRIRAGQAKRAMINPDWQEQPGLAFGQQLFNSGGLANLFRVKNQ